MELNGSALQHSKTPTYSVDSKEIPQLEAVHITPHMIVLYDVLELSSQTKSGNSNILTRRSRSDYVRLSFHSLFSLADVVKLFSLG